jgi:hypothetical protein
MFPAVEILHRGLPRYRWELLAADTLGQLHIFSVCHLWVDVCIDSPLTAWRLQLCLPFPAQAEQLSPCWCVVVLLLHPLLLVSREELLVELDKLEEEHANITVSNPRVVEEYR